MSVSRHKPVFCISRLYFSIPLPPPDQNLKLYIKKNCMNNGKMLLNLNKKCTVTLSKLNGKSCKHLCLK